MDKAPSMMGLMSVAPPLKSLPTASANNDPTKLQSKFSLVDILKSGTDTTN